MASGSMDHHKHEVNHDLAVPASASLPATSAALNAGVAAVAVGGEGATTGSRVGSRQTSPSSITRSHLTPTSPSAGGASSASISYAASPSLEDAHDLTTDTGSLTRADSDSGYMPSSPSLEDARLSPLSSGGGGGQHDGTNLIVNYLPPSLNEDMLRALFEPYGILERCKIVNDKFTGMSLGYGFVRYSSAPPSSLTAALAAANNAVAALNGHALANKRLKVSLSKQPAKDRKANLYISGIPSSWTQVELTDLVQRFGPIQEVRTLVDASTNRCRGVGFARFESAKSAALCIAALNGTTVPGGIMPLNVRFADTTSDKIRKSMVASGSAPTSPYVSPPSGYRFAATTGQPHQVHVVPNLRYVQSATVSPTHHGHYGSLNHAPSPFQADPLTAAVVAAAHQQQAVQAQAQAAQAQAHAAVQNLFIRSASGGSAGMLLQNGATIHSNAPLYSPAGTSMLHSTLSQQAPLHQVRPLGSHAAAAANLLASSPQGSPRSGGQTQLPTYHQHNAAVVQQASAAAAAHAAAASASLAMQLPPPSTVETSLSPGTCLFVYHLPMEATESTLVQLFGQCGTVTSVKVMRDLSTGRSKGFAFVNMQTEQQAATCVQALNGFNLGSKYIKVTFKQQK